MLLSSLSSFLPKAYLLAQLTVCPIEAAPRVEVNLAVDNLFYSEAATVEQLKKEMRPHQNEALNEWDTVGLTSRNITSKTYATFKTLHDNSGNFCFYVDKVTVTVQYSPAIFIAKDILDRKCLYEGTKDHEKRHVEVDIKGLKEYLPKIQMEMLLYLKSMGYQGYGPMAESQMKAGTQAVLKKIVEAGNPVAEKMHKVIRKGHAEMDNMQNYRHEQSACFHESPLPPVETETR